MLLSFYQGKEKISFQLDPITYSLYRPAEKVNYILRQCEWNDEQKLLNQYHIPRKSIFVAKALNAHDDWDFGGEYKILLQGQLYEQAKMSLLYFVLPRYFSGKCWMVLVYAANYSCKNSFF